VEDRRLNLSQEVYKENVNIAIKVCVAEDERKRPGKANALDQRRTQDTTLERKELPHTPRDNIHNGL